MRKVLIISILSILLYSSCEKDDFCIEPVTPNLVVRFYDASNPTATKSVSNLTVWSEGRDILYNGIATDSIVIPLETHVNQTIYNFSNGTTEDQLTISYQVEEDFVSRSCGFRAIFNDLNVSTSNNWVQAVSVQDNSVTNESTAHVQVFH